jgi:N4-gp56 family major capsid protein
MYLNLAELREATRGMKRNNIKGVRSESGRFVVVTHPDAMYDLQSDPNIINILQYSPSTDRNNDLFGPAFSDLPFGLRIFETTNARIFAAAGLSAANVYQTHVIGEEAYAVIGYQAFPPQIIRKERGSGGATGDPLDQVASIGWKASHTAVILDQARQVVIEHATSS